MRLRWSGMTLMLRGPFLLVRKGGCLLRGRRRLSPESRHTFPVGTANTGHTAVYNPKQRGRRIIKKLSLFFSFNFLNTSKTVAISQATRTTTELDHCAKVWQYLVVTAAQEKGAACRHQTSQKSFPHLMSWLTHPSSWLEWKPSPH